MWSGGFKRNMIKHLSIALIFFSSSVIGQEIGGTGWLLNYSSDKQIVLFNKNGTIQYLMLISSFGNEGEIFGDEDDTWTLNGNRLVISYNNGHMLCSCEFSNRIELSGTCVNKKGVVDKVIGTLIE